MWCSACVPLDENEIDASVAQAAAMFVAAESEDLTNESWGYIFHYVVWYALTQPLLPAEAYGALRLLLHLLGPLAQVFVIRQLGQLLQPFLRHPIRPSFAR